VNCRIPGESKRFFSDVHSGSCVRRDIECVCVCSCVMLFIVVCKSCGGVSYLWLASSVFVFVCGGLFDVTLLSLFFLDGEPRFDDINHDYVFPVGVEFLPPTNVRPELLSRNKNFINIG